MYTSQAKVTRGSEWSRRFLKRDFTDIRSRYIPYIAYNMLEANDTDYYNVKGIQINDPSINHGDTMTEGI